MTYKAVYCFLLTLAVLFLSLPGTTMAQSNPSETLLREHFLQEKLNRKLNQAMFEALEICLTNQPHSEFSRQFYNMAGDLISVQHSCQQLVEEVLRKPIRKHYTKMRLDLALSSPGYRDTNILRVEYGHDNSLKLRENAQHLLANVLAEVSIAKLNSLNKEELAAAVAEFNRFRDENCIKVFLNKKLSEGDRAKAFKLCDRLKNENFQAVKDSLYFEDNYQVLFGILKGIESHMYSDRVEFHREKLKSYMKAITRLPILIMVNSANPSDEELLKIVREQKSYAGSVTTQIDSMNRSFHLTEKRLMELARLTGGVSPTALNSVKRNFPEVADWNAVFTQVNQKAQMLNDAEADKDMQDLFLISAGCALLLKGPWAVGCSSFLYALTTGMNYSVYNSQLQDILARIDQNLRQEDSASTALLAQLEKTEKTAVINLLIALPALKATSQVDTIKILERIFKIKDPKAIPAAFY